MDLNSNIENNIMKDEKLPFIKDIHLIDNNDLDYVPIGFFLGIASTYYGAFFNKYLYGLDLNLKQFFILLAINDEENMTQERLSSILNINEATLTREINTLEKNGFITRRIDENDKRKKIITISNKFNEKIKCIKDIDYESESQLLNYFSTEEIHILKYLLKKIIISLEDIVE